MSVRVYVLLDIVEGKSEYVVQMLRSRTGVVLVDSLEGRPDVIVVVEAPNRQGLAEALMPVIGCVDGITEDLRLLVTPDESLRNGRKKQSIPSPDYDTFKKTRLANKAGISDAKINAK